MVAFATAEIPSPLTLQLEHSHCCRFYKHGFSSSLQNQVNFQLSRQNSSKRPAPGTPPSCSHHLQHGRTETHFLFLLFFTAPILSLPHSRPTGRTTKTFFYFSFYHLFSRCKPSGFFCRSRLIARHNAHRHTCFFYPNPAYWLTKLIGEASVVSFPCHANAEHLNTVHHAVFVFGSLLNMQEPLPVAWHKLSSPQ